MKKEINCKHCGELHYKKEVERVLGKESMPAILDFCSAVCYTKSIGAKKEVYIPINWLLVSDGNLPAATEKGYEATLVHGTSDRVLIFCSDGIERFGRYVHNKLNRWNVEGCAGQPNDFVTRFAYLNEPESI